MSDNRYVTFKVTFESLTPTEVEAERKAEEENYLNSDWNQQPNERDEARVIRYLEMPLSAAVPFEQDLNRLIDEYHHIDCRI